ncbi:hypothetical protein HanRHA438_Chr09g0394421 [Helianthus annuus]|uniref:Autophagy-related protein 27 n=1 Tax=Helianthus annuus TaxID=4232 RepID=A0A9K3JZF7_HELAN|nr:uncharacterized protein LOC110878182 isoform X1 [Helianthus annuus]KAF5824204.1 hypothetical protein HanXRQr2_Chr00c066g0833611 [Helianthus annuus]KAJ0525622.1 hypothetical protein HanHA300_Chr09g0314161 [Helianthus annuus]KAJ0542005.1 hypothetical protein HanHA89_Chr09g0335031 [Helianthus annuus]KAJ0887748.1 hypothetical protein HanRHA438_Chr09g0394421 [Helianthus annuus]KAJ0892682.1 hypothetical protein HanPSC8_Chr09g0368831 [Helianthus annuus]
MYLRRFLLLLLLLLLLLQHICLTPSVSAVCEYSITDNNKVYSFNLAASSKQFPHGVLSEDGYYKVSSNGTVVWFQLCESMIFNHDPPKCFDCWECGGSARCGMGCSALMSNNINGYPICTTIGRTPTITTDLIGNKKSPNMGLVVKMWHSGVVNCSLSVSVVCDSKQVEGPTILERVDFCDYITQLRHPSGCAITVSSNNGGLGWFGTLVIVILGLFGGYLIAGAVYRFFYLHIRGIDIIPNLEFWASLSHRAQSAFMSLVKRHRQRSSSSYTSVDF